MFIKYVKFFVNIEINPELRYPFIEIDKSKIISSGKKYTGNMGWYIAKLRKQVFALY